ncbi:MAG: hypothetical protein H6R34_530 [Bacteroidetes bacterium]|nr:hypothetical protein [Bacteroidota bacterium]
MDRENHREVQGGGLNEKPCRIPGMPAGLCFKRRGRGELFFQCTQDGCGQQFALFVKCF